MDALPYVDVLFREYLLFRGFTKTLQAFNADKASDRGCGFQAEQVSNLIFGRLIPQYDGQALVELIGFLKSALFCRLPKELESSASKLEVSVLRLYLVHAIEANKMEVVHKFFSSFGEQLNSGEHASEWSSWCALPFLQKPQRDPRFQVYFTKPWKQLVEASFRNCMAEAVQQLPLPAVLRFNIDRKQRQDLQRKVDALQAEVERLRAQLKQRTPLRNASVDLDRASSFAEVQTSTAQPASSWSLTDMLDSDYMADLARQRQRNTSRSTTPGPNMGPGGKLPDTRAALSEGRRDDWLRNSSDGAIRRLEASGSKQGTKTVSDNDAELDTMLAGHNSSLEANSSVESRPAEGVIGQHPWSPAGPRISLDTAVLLNDMSDNELESNKLLPKTQAMDLMQQEQLKTPFDEALRGDSGASWEQSSEEAAPHAPRNESHGSPAVAQRSLGSTGSLKIEDEQESLATTSRGQSVSVPYRSPGQRVTDEATGPKAASTDGMLGLAGKQEQLKGHEVVINDVIFAPDGRNIASASADGVVRIWAPGSLEGNTERSAVLLCGAPVRRLAWDTRADKVMLVGTEGKGVKAWHLDTKRMVAHMRPDPAFPNITDVACSPTDPSFLCASSTAGKGLPAGRLSLWNLRAFRKVHTFRGEAALHSACFSPDGRTIATSGDDGFVQLFDTSTNVLTASFPHASGQQLDGSSFVRFIGPDGASLMTLSPDGLLKIWDFAMLKGPTWQLDVSAHCCSQAPSQQQTFAASPDGTFAVLTSAAGSAPIFQLFSKRPMAGSAGGHRAAVTAVAWHPDLMVVASGSADRMLLVSHIQIQR